MLQDAPDGSGLFYQKYNIALRSPSQDTESDYLLKLCFVLIIAYKRALFYFRSLVFSLRSCFSSSFDVSFTVCLVDSFMSL